MTAQIKSFNTTDNIQFEGTPNPLPVFLGTMENKHYFVFSETTPIPDNAIDTTAEEILQLKERSVVFRGIKESMERQVAKAYAPERAETSISRYLSIQNTESPTDAQTTEKNAIGTIFTRVEQLDTRRKDIENLLLQGVVVDTTMDDVWSETYVLPTA